LGFAVKKRENRFFAQFCSTNLIILGLERELNFEISKGTHTEISNTTRGCRLWDVKNSGFENSSSTEVKRTFHQNWSIFITKKNDAL
jgi:hypothetical protein